MQIIDTILECIIKAMLVLLPIIVIVMIPAILLLILNITSFVFYYMLFPIVMLLAGIVLLGVFIIMGMMLYEAIRLAFSW
jgi:hypothetical protein